jgi:hypothetical protein
MRETREKWRAGQVAFFDATTQETIKPVSPVVLYDDFLGSVVNGDLWSQEDTNDATKAIAASALTFTIAATDQIEDAGIYMRPAPANTGWFKAAGNMQLGAYALINTKFPGGGVGYVTATSTQVGGFDDTMGTLDIVGTDIDDAPATESIIPLNGSTVVGTQLFKTITSITGAGWTRDGAGGSEDTIVIGCSTAVGSFRFDKGLIFETRVKVTTNPGGKAEIMLGLAGDPYLTDNQVAEADDIDYHAFFVFDGAATCTIYADDNTANTKNAIATGHSADAAYHIYRIDAIETEDVKFYIDGDQVAKTTTFDMSGMDGDFRVMPYLMATKASGNGQCVYAVDYIKIWQAIR